MEHFPIAPAFQTEFAYLLQDFQIHPSSKTLNRMEKLIDDSVNALREGNLVDFRALNDIKQKLFRLAVDQDACIIDKINFLLETVHLNHPSVSMMSNEMLLEVLAALSEEDLSRIALKSRHLAKNIGNPHILAPLVEKTLKNLSYETQLKLLQRYGMTIRTLDLSQNLTLTTAQLNELISCCPTLDSINLTWCNSLTNESLAVIAPCLTNLHSLNLTWCKAIGNDGLKALLPYASKLRSLNLTWCEQLTAEGLFSLALLPALECLNLSCCNVSDELLAALAPHLMNLHILYLSKCKQITNEGLAALAPLSHLWSLNLTKCTQVTEEGLKNLPQHIQVIK